ncbi:MAG: hypothetical protein E7Z69_08520 [Thermoplasmata archaeon]|jgi:hypothetical protein|nr:hypothetical protein [Thermoplasmata archaeon]
MVLVVYRSHTGSTKKYAEALAARGGLECIPVRKLKDQEGEIVFFGWLRGSQVVGLSGIDGSRLKAVCVVGLDNRFDKASVVSKNKIKCHVYYLRGWFEPRKVNPFERLFIYVVAAVMKLKGLNQHNQPIFDAMMEGGSFYDESALDDVAKFLKLRYRQNPYQPSKPIPFP